MSYHKKNFQYVPKSSQNNSFKRSSTSPKQIYVKKIPTENKSSDNYSSPEQINIIQLIDNNNPQPTSQILVQDQELMTKELTHSPKPKSPKSVGSFEDSLNINNEMNKSQNEETGIVPEEEEKNDKNADKEKTVSFKGIKDIPPKIHKKRKYHSEKGYSQNEDSHDAYEIKESIKDEDTLSQPKSETTYSALTDQKEILSNAATLGSQEEERNLEKADEVLQVIQEQNELNISQQEEEGEGFPHNDEKNKGRLNEIEEEDYLRQNSSGLSNYEEPYDDDFSEEKFESPEHRALSVKSKEQGSLKREEIFSKDSRDEDNLRKQEMNEEETFEKVESNINSQDNIKLEEIKEEKLSNDEISVEERLREPRMKEEAKSLEINTHLDNLSQVHYNETKSLEIRTEESPRNTEPKITARSDNTHQKDYRSHNVHINQINRILNDYTKRYQYCTECKARGNKLFSESNYDEALEQYRLGYEYLVEEEILQYFYVNKSMYENCINLKRDLKLNASFMSLKLERYKEAYQLTTDVLTLIDEKNSKAFFRRGLAAKGLGRLEQAKSDFENAYKLTPLDAKVKEELMLIKKELDNQDKSKDVIFKDIFSKNKTEKRPSRFSMFGKIFKGKNAMMLSGGIGILAIVGITTAYFLRKKK